MADPVISCLAAAPCDYQPHLAISRVLSERLLVTAVTSNFIISPLTLRRVVWQQSIVTDVCKRVLYLLHEVYLHWNNMRNILGLASFIFLS